ncbi:uncharacterized protein Ecym_3380 [Eremothecium cymbalariae DBVPG|uniref:Uncharacterized protein n=1 Tax=Eremothecium cymbalariae (strain CBS 270.75 / DBVPG 7215 / KCTC 17166 / NRRL Y-17582) TaxID=931890 RepID=G8JRU8_ERECY|nr:Hypothetical protein Ecym_3380 [Eremothecium cymbalariae DBVPG\
MSSPFLKTGRIFMQPIDVSSNIVGNSLNLTNHAQRPQWSRASHNYTTYLLHKHMPSYTKRPLRQPGVSIPTAQTFLYTTPLPFRKRSCRNPYTRPDGALLPAAAAGLPAKRTTPFPRHKYSADSALSAR